MNFKVIVAVVLFAVAFGFQSLMTSQVITMDRYILDILFIVIVLAFIGVYFRKVFYKVCEKTSLTDGLLLLLTSLTFHFVSSYFIISYFDQPVWPFDSRGSSFLLMNSYFLWAKPFDVLLQQVLIVLLVKKLHQYKLTVKQITALFVFGFGFIHIFQIFRTDFTIGLGYTLGAMIFSLIFPYMIINVKNGYIYNFMIHLVTYNVAALLAWTLY